MKVAWEYGEYYPVLSVYDDPEDSYYRISVAQGRAPVDVPDDLVRAFHETWRAHDDISEQISDIITTARGAVQ